ncbi:MAG: Tetratricopeptide 2 repeat protein [Bryobacterales bacterium]|nr:Tetratricopeptide 2 repeat protein [Bryobacterales bacterium]
MIELQRDVAQLQDQMRLLQQSFDTRIAQVQLLTQQALDTASKSNASINDLARVIQNDSANVGRQVAQPVAALGARVDTLSQDLSGLQSTVADQTSRLGQIQQQLVDLKNLLSTMQAPAAPPPTAGAVSPGGPAPISSTGPAPNSAMPPIPSAQLYQNAKRDMDGGNNDLALNEFADYLNYYRSTDLAPNAQFYIGQIHYTQKKFEVAVKDFDQVLEAFPINPKTPDAHYMKGRALVQLGQRNEAAKEFKTVLAQFPTSPAAPNCRESLKGLGMSPPAPSSASRKKR